MINDQCRKCNVFGAVVTAIGICPDCMVDEHEAKEARTKAQAEARKASRYFANTKRRIKL